MVRINIDICDALNTLTAQRQNAQNRIVQVTKPIRKPRHAMMRTATRHKDGPRPLRQHLGCQHDATGTGCGSAKHIGEDRV